MLYRVRRSLSYWRFDRAIAGVFDTPPIQAVPAPWAVVSMVAPKDVGMYLLAIKAFHRRAGAGQVVAIVHRDMPQAGLDALRRHVRGIEILVREDLDTGGCQRGGTWERLVHCLRRAEREYVVQMDADVLACGADLAEVGRCVRENRAFTLADTDRFVTMEEAARMARAMDGDYIGTVAERGFDRFPGAAGLRYIRGSSGFAGYARGAFPVSRIEAFHREGERLVGHERWREWGTEQCGSNFAVANSPGAEALSAPLYVNFVPGRADPRTKLFHFIGSSRFAEGLYARLGQAEIARLRAPPAARAA